MFEDSRLELPIYWELGMGHGAWGMGHGGWEWGMGIGNAPDFELQVFYDY
ncbi:MULTISPECIES: hypothetical protein [unclassified Microcoleus]